MRKLFLLLGFLVVPTVQAAQYAPVRPAAASGATAWTQIDHDQTTNFVANEHIDWTGDQGATNIHAGNIPDLSGTYQPLDALLTSISALTGLTGSDLDIVTGTAGVSGNCAEWNVDGDLVDAGAACGAGSGDVTKVGTPVDGQVGVWTGDGTIEGDAALTFDTTDDTLVVGASGKVGFGAVDVLSDAAGTTTLANIDAIDATTEATFEAAIDSLVNLVTVGTIGTGTWQGTAIADGYIPNDITIDLATAASGLNATAVTGNAVDNSTLVGTGANAAGYVTLPSCSDEAETLGFNTTTGAWICNADAGAGGGMTSFTVQGDSGGGMTVTDGETLDFTGDLGLKTVDATGSPEQLTYEFDYALTLAGNPALAIDECVFSTDGTGGGIICEGTAADSFEGLLVFPVTTSDKTLTLPDATDTLVGRDTTDTLTNKTLAAANNVIDADTAVALAANPADCAANEFANTIAASGDLSCAAIVDADVPNSITIDLATVATTANAGDSATAFFSAGTIEHEYGGLEANVSAYAGLIRVDAGVTSNVTNLAGLNTALSTGLVTGAHTTDTGPSPDCSGTTTYQDGEGGCDDISSVYEGILTNSAGLASALNDETGTGVAVFAISPTVQGKIDRTGTAVNDDDCTGEQGSYWYDSTDSAFEFCNANSGVPDVLGGGGGAPTDATYITQTADGTLSAEQALSSLSTGIMRVATATGVVTSLTDSAGVLANISDETGSGVLVAGTAPTLQGKIDRTGTAVNDDDCTGEQGSYWYDSTDSQFEFCNADSGTPTAFSAGGGDFSGPASATDNAVVRFDGTGGKTGQNSGVVINDSNSLTLAGDVVFTEKADHTETPGAGSGYLWTKSTTPSTLIFTDDAGTDTTLGSGGGGSSKLIWRVTNNVSPLESGDNDLGCWRTTEAMTLTDIRASVVTGGGTSGTLTIDVNEGATTIMSTNKLDIQYNATVDDGTVALSDTAIAADAVLCADIDAISTAATELGITIELDY